MIDYDDFPQDFSEGLKRYIEHGIRPGSFLSAVLEGDLYEAVARGSDDSLRSIAELVKNITWHLPADCFGSKERVSEWLHRSSNLYLGY